MTRTKFSARFLCLAALLLASIPAGRLLAQSPTGSVSGNVVDSSGGGVPGAAVSARNVNTGAARTATSGTAGQFTFPYPTVGKSTPLSAELSGSLRDGHQRDRYGRRRFDRQLVLEPAGVQASVTVSSEAPLIETTRSEQASVVGEKLIANRRRTAGAFSTSR
jgi:hypothetical protein